MELKSQTLFWRWRGKMEFEEEVYAIEDLSGEPNSLPISLEKLLLWSSRNEKRKKNIIYYLRRRARDQNNPPALENNLPVCSDRCCLGEVTPSPDVTVLRVAAPSLSPLCWTRCVKALLEGFLYAEQQQNSSLKLQGAALGSSLALWFQDVAELAGSSLLTHHKSHVKPTNARVSSALFPHRNPRSGNEGNSLSLPFSPLELISQHCW